MFSKEHRQRAQDLLIPLTNLKPGKAPPHRLSPITHRRHQSVMKVKFCNLSELSPLAQ